MAPLTREKGEADSRERTETVLVRWWFDVGSYVHTARKGNNSSRAGVCGSKTAGISRFPGSYVQSGHWFEDGIRMRG